MMRVAWGLYAAFGLLWVYGAARPGRPRPMGDEVIGLMNGFQVSVGLLLLSVGAAASLAEERARGSLDVLLSTPMSTSSILAGKWWGSFRRVFSVAIWPAADGPVPRLRPRPLGGLRAAARPGAGLRRGDHQPGPGGGDVGAPAGPRRRAVRHGLRPLPHHLADLGSVQREWMVVVGEHHHRDDDGRSSVRRIHRHAGRLGIELPQRRFPPTRRRLPRDIRLDRGPCRHRGLPLPRDAAHIRPLPGAGPRERHAAVLEPARAIVAVDQPSWWPWCRRPPRGPNEDLEARTNNK